MKKIANTKKLVLTTVVVRELQQNLSDADLKAVAGGISGEIRPSRTLPTTVQAAYQC